MKKENQEEITITLLGSPSRSKGALDCICRIAQAHLNHYTEEELESAAEYLQADMPEIVDNHILVSEKRDTENALTHPEKKPRDLHLIQILAGLTNLKLVEDTLIKKKKVSAITATEISLTGAAQILMATLDKTFIGKNQLSDLISPDMKGVKIYKGSQVGLHNRYSKKRRLYAEAEKVAEAKWNDGCTMKHHKMKEWLLNECTDENGQLRFLDPEISEKTLGEKLKKVLYRIGKADDLIHGLSKK